MTPNMKKGTNCDSIENKSFTLSDMKNHKISTSRGLELYSKVFIKEKGENLEKVKVYHQKKLINDKIKEGNSNLEAKQITLQ
jgi:hypothetical protein